MTEQTIRFSDGAAYEEMMGVWSRFAGDIFLDWLAPPSGLRWIDIGCGNGAFTQLLVERCAPLEVQGIDPSEEQLAFARTRLSARLAEFSQGDAMALPFPASKFDAAVMALVLVFVPDPAKGIEEMVRVVRPGGTVATYMWDMLGGGFLSIQSTSRSARWVSRRRVLQRWRRLKWRHYKLCGRPPVSRPWRRARSRYTEHLRVLTTSG